MSARPQPSDARIPCPVCASPIHPIAGKCKHCKADLASLRQARPAAMAALPPLVRHAVAPQFSAPQPQYATPLAVPVDTTTLRDEPPPILPPRPTGRMPSATVKRSSWKSWPVIVICLATIAIVAAVVLMAFPPGSSASADTGKRNLEPPPAPEHMDTNPMTPSVPHSQVTPPPAPPRHTPAPPADPDPADPFAGIGGLGGRGGGTVNPFGHSGGMAMLGAVLKHACDRLKQCGTIDSMVRVMCDMQLRSMPTTAPPSCSAAQRCLEKVDQIDCGTQADDMSGILSLTQNLTDCAEAITSC